MSVAPLVGLVRDELRAAADPERAPAMQAYMRSTMPFRGVPLPRVRTIAMAAAQDLPPVTLEELADVVRELWDEAAFREERYAGSALLRLPLAGGELRLVPLLEHLAVTGAWWDHVDDLAHRIAALHDAHPSETAAVVRAWGRSHDRWLRRLAIIGQLGRRDRVDPAVLADVVEANVDDRDPFVRKAIGWALREYARVEPEWVRAFVAEREDRLSGLSKREALKHVG